MINKTAIIDPKAKISSSVKIGPYTVIGPNVEIDNNTIIQSIIIKTRLNIIHLQNTTTSYSNNLIRNHIFM